MNKRKWTIWLSAALLIVLAVTGYFAIAAELGSKQDPLVTLSYITDVLSPETAAIIEKAFTDKKAEFDSLIDSKVQATVTDFDKKVAEYKSSLAGGAISDETINAVAEQVVNKLKADGTIGQAGAVAGGTSEGASWAVYQLPAGKTLTAEVGCEILLRIGAASCVSSGSPGLINLSAGTELPNGGALAVNNLYIVTVKGRGITSAAGCTVVISGKYSVS